MKKYSLIILIISSFLFQTCWMPPYNSEISNALYLIQKMDFKGELILDESIPNNYMNIEDLYLGRAKLFSSLTAPDTRFYYMMEDSLYVLVVQNGYFYRAVEDISGTSTLVPRFPEYGINHFYPARNRSSSNLYIHCYDDEDSLTLDSLQFIYRDQDLNDGPARLTFKKAVMDDSAMQWIETQQNKPFADTNDVLEVHAIDPYYPETNGNKLYIRSLERINTQFSLWDYHIDNIDNTGDMDSGLFSKIIDINVTPETFSLVSSRMAFVNDHQVVFSVLENEMFKNYLVDTNLGTVETTDRYVKIEGLGETELAVTSLSGGYILFQGKDSYDQYHFSLWKPGSTPVKLNGGKLIFVKRMLKNGEFYLQFNYFRQNNEEYDQRSLLFYSIKESDFIGLF